MKKHTIYEFSLNRPHEMRRNVRYDCNGFLGPVGTPGELIHARGKPLLCRATDCGEVIVSHDGDGVMTENASTGECRRVISGKATPVSAANVAQGVIVNYGTAGVPSAMIRFDDTTGHGIAEQAVERYCAPRLRRVDHAPVTAVMPVRMLKGSYTSRSTALELTDVATLTADYAAAYCALTESAAAAHQFVQPVMARVRGRDSAGRITYESAPVMVSPATGVQCAYTEMTLSGDSYALTSGASLHAVPFSLAIDFPVALSQAWRERVTSLEIQVSGQFHPADFSGVSAVKFLSSTPLQTTIRVSMPGMEVASRPVAGDGTEMRRRVEGALCHIDSVMLTAHTMNTAGISAGDSVAGIYAAATADARRQMSALLKAVTAPVTAADAGSMMLLTMNYPHTFGAECVTAGGNSLLWGNLTSRLFDGYTADEYSVSRTASASGTVPATAIVTMASGKRLVTSGLLSGSVPDGISPLLTYPHPAATNITLMVGLRRMSVDLRPTPDGRMAYALASDCKCMTITDEMPLHAAPTADAVVEYHPDALAVSGAADPMRLIAATSSGIGRIRAVSAAGRSNSGWDYSRPRFYAFTTGGICTVTSTASLSEISSVLLDHRVVNSADAVCDLEGEVAAVASGDVIRLKGSNVSTLIAACGDRMLGWCAARCELWVASAIGEPVIVYNTMTGDSYHRDDVDPCAIICSGGRPLIITDDRRVLDTAVEMSTPKAIRLTYSATLPKAKAVTGVSVRFYGENVAGDIIFTADNGCHSESTYRVVAFHIDGTLDRPIEGRVYAHPYRYVRLHIIATVSPDTRLHRALFTAKP